MNKHKAQDNPRKFRAIHRLLHTGAVVRLVVVAGLIALGVAGFTQQGGVAHAVQSVNDYCGQYSNSDETNACKDGISGANCSDYVDLFGQKVADICSKSASAKQHGLVSDAVSTPSSSASASSSPSPSPTGSSGTTADDPDAYKNAILLACAPYQSDQEQALSCLYGGLGQDGTAGKPVTLSDCLSSPNLVGSDNNEQKNRDACIAGATAGSAYISTQKSSSSSSNPNAIQDVLDGVLNLNSLIGAIHSLTPDAKTDTSKQPDNNRDSYVNGAGKQQQIKVWPASGDKAPAIVWFNGGGWVANDGTAEQIAFGGAQKNIDKNKPMAGPAGGGANARGFTVIEVTYRLGTSGVYYQFDDVLRGLRHVINNASLYGIDPAKIAVGGDSAGASLSMRVAASGKSGAKVAVGWSAPTNAYTALFKSYKTFLIGMIHSTCVPTDLAGAANMADLLNGGTGKVAEYGKTPLSGGIGDLQSLQGLVNGDGGSGSPLNLITEVMTGAQYAATTGTTIESISKKLEAAYADGKPTLQTFMSSGLPSGLFNMSAQKLGECIDNFNALSPALFASPDTPPSFLSGFDDDDLVDPQQLYDMRDKLHTMGIRSEVQIIQGDPSNEHAPGTEFGATDNHMGYDPRAVCPTLNFIDSIVKSPGGNVDCDNPKPTVPQLPGLPGGGGGGSSSSKSGGSNTNSDCNSKGDGSYWDPATKKCISGSTAKTSCEANAANNPGQMYWDGGSKKCMAGEQPLTMRQACIANAANNPGQMYWDGGSGQCMAGQPKKPFSRSYYGSGEICKNGDTGCIPGAFKNAPIPGPF